MKKFKFFKKLNSEYLLLAIILVFGFFLRIWNLGLPSLWIDESTSAIVSLNILFLFYMLRILLIIQK